MASGETLAKWKAQDNEPPTTNFATRDSRNSHPVLDFAIDEIGVFSDVLVNYGNSGLTVKIHIAMSSATANDIKLEVSIERIGEVLDTDTDSFAAAQNSGDITVPETSGVPKVLTITFTNGAQMDNILVDEEYRLKVKRVTVTGTDATGDLEVRKIRVIES